MDCFENQGMMSQLLAEAAWRHIPAAVFAELTRACNLRCRHCYLTDYDTRDELTTREWLGILDQATALGGFMFTISGGEPLLRDDVEEIAAHSVELGYFTRLFTNGTLIDAARAEKLARVRWQAIEVSLHGATAQSHDALTGMPGSFAQALAGMGLLRQAGVPVVMKSMISVYNVHEIKAMRELALELGATMRISPIISLKEDGGCAPAYCRLDDEGLQEALFMLRSFSEAKAEQPRLNSDGSNVAASLALGCSAGKASYEVKANGDITPCVALTMVLGNLRLQNLNEIWYNNARVERLLQLGEVKIPECLQCEYSYYCIRCPGSALGESGSLLLPSMEECRFARANWKVEDTLWQKENT